MVGGTVAATNSILSLTKSSSKMNSKWGKLLPPMTTDRSFPTAVATLTHLVVGGGRTGVLLAVISTVEVLSLDTHQWTFAQSMPAFAERNMHMIMDGVLMYPKMTLCASELYVRLNNQVFYCSVQRLLETCRPASTSSDVWSRVADIPVPYRATLVTLKGHILAMGGSDKFKAGTPTRAMHRYDRSTDSWSVIGEIPTPRSSPLVVVLPSGNEIIVVGGLQCNVTEIGTFIPENNICM